MKSGFLVAIGARMPDQYDRSHMIKQLLMS